MDVHLIKKFTLCQDVQYSTIGIGHFEMGIVCNLPSTINMPNDNPPAFLILGKYSKNSPLDIVRENYCLLLLQTFQKLCEV